MPVLIQRRNNALLQRPYTRTQTKANKMPNTKANTKATAKATATKAVKAKPSSKAKAKPLAKAKPSASPLTAHGLPQRSPINGTTLFLAVKPSQTAIVTDKPAGPNGHDDELATMLRKTYDYKTIWERGQIDAARLSRLISRGYAKTVGKHNPTDCRAKQYQLIDPNKA